MANYPSVYDTFSNPQGTTLVASDDHALQHRNAGSAIVGIEQTLGTTAGTNVLKDFSAGNFPARINSSGVAQQVLSGTVNLAAGTITGQLVNSGTVGGGVYGTALHSGGTLTGQMVASGTIAGGVYGTAQYTGGTATNLTVNGGTNVYHAMGSLTYPGTVSTTITLQCGSASRHLINMPNSAGSITLAVAGAIASQPFIVEIMQGTAGLGTINWFSTLRWAGSATPTQTLTASRKDTFGFIATSTTTFDGYIVGQNV